MQLFESFRATRWIRTLNLVLQALLFTTLCAGLNYLALHYSWRTDLTHARRYSLSPETLSYLKDLARPVRVVVTLTEDPQHPENAQVFTDVRDLLREYAHATEANENRLTVEYLDVYQRRREAEQLGLDQPNCILFLSGDKPHVVTAGELYRIVGGERKDFRGEQAFTSAILDVSRPDRQKIYFLTGHGEQRIDDVDPRTGLSALAADLRLRNFALDTLDINFARKVPEDAALVIVAAPQGIVSFEQEQLRQYLGTRAGRVVLLLAPDTKPGLDDLLHDWGVMVDDDVIYDTNPDSSTETGDLIIVAYQAHPITQTMMDRVIPLTLGFTRSVRPEPGRAQGSGLTVTTLAATSQSAWGERNYRRRGVPEYNPGVDLKGLPQMDPADRLGVAVASERVQARGNLPFSVRSGRLVVVGTADLVTNSRFQGAPGNYNFFLNAINWAVDRDTQLNIPPRLVERFQLALSQQELFRLRYCLLLLVPGAAALLGLMVYWSRRT
jgi:hypothetical protein